MSQVINLCCNSVLQNVISFTVTCLAYLHLFTVKLMQEGRRGGKNRQIYLQKCVCIPSVDQIDLCLYQSTSR